jgi:hypothetical protein
MIACPECAAEHLPGTLFCDRCGAAVHPAAQAHVARVAPARRGPFVDSAAAEDAPARRRPEIVPPPAPDTLPPALNATIVHRRHALTLRGAAIHIGRADPDAASARSWT